MPIVRPPVRETMALGAAYLAGLAVGVWKRIEELGDRMPAERRFMSTMRRVRVERLTPRWKRAMERARNWVET
jgi:glycerol kinase